MFRSDYPVPKGLIADRAEGFGLCFFRLNLWYRVIVNGNVEAPVNCILNPELELLDLCDALCVAQAGEVSSHE